MAYNHKKLGKIVADCLERGGTVEISYPHCDFRDLKHTTPQQALFFIDRARNVLRLEDKPIIIQDYDAPGITDLCTYTTRKENNIRLNSTFVKPSTVDEDKL